MRSGGTRRQQFSKAERRMPRTGHSRDEIFSVQAYGPGMSLRSRLLGAVTLLTTLALVTAAPPAGAAPAAPTATDPTAAASIAANDWCLGQCHDILPPGQNGNATVAEVLANKATGAMPGHASDQLGRYAGLVYGYAGLREDQIGSFFADASFGVTADQVERSYQPRADVTVVRDKATGVPHVTGSTRGGTMFGAGYAGAEDRLFTMDLLRHVGRGTLTPFAGGSPGNRALEQSLWKIAPYTEADLNAQVTRLGTLGDRGRQLVTDLQSYLDGINAYIDACMAGRYCPGEYVLTGNLDSVSNAGGPIHFGLADIVAIGGVIGGLFGIGGGAEMQSALVRVSARARYGPAEGDTVWQAFRAQNDPEAVLTLHDGQSFPYGTAPADSAGVVLPDAGSVRAAPITADPTGSATTGSATTGSATAAAGGRSAELANALSGLTLGTGRGMSNAAVVSGAHTTTGNPIAVFGPQTGYFAPQLLMTQELQGPGISARGVAFAGLNMYVLLGRGQDYAWSATSSAHDITDMYALPLCTTDGSTPTVTADHYSYGEQCLAMEELAHVNTWKPSVADATAAGSYRIVAQRTRLGLVAWRGTVGGQPYAFAQLRSTYRHEAESAIGFQMFNDPAAMGDAAAFSTSAANVDYAFNWFYVNSRQSAYHNSGRNPVRATGSDPNLPMKAEPAYQWQGYDPATNTATYASPAAHPQSTDQDYYISWNNKAAKDFSAADGNFSFGAVQRADLLDKLIGPAVRSGTKLDRAALVKLVEKAGLTDLRGVEVLDELIRVLQSQPVTDAALRTTVEQLTAWKAAGALRVETAKGSKVYQHADAIRVFDAWWPLLVTGEFKASLGDDLFQNMINALQLNQSPSHKQRGQTATLGSGLDAQPQHEGSAFQYGWWGYVDKDLRSLLGDTVAGGLGEVHCGDGVLAACRAMLLDTLRAAAAQSAATVYPADDACAAGDQWCADAIRQSPLGGVTHPLIAWQNRPTYQQVVSFPARRGDSLANLAAKAPVTASGSQLFFPVTNAVDGDPGTRWASSWEDNQWIRVDLGSSKQVGRVLTAWEAAYPTAYRIEVSTDGATWRTVATTATGDGGRDVLAFTPTTARYVKLTAITRATQYGISLFELEVYPR
jgi:acyl-homoserine lactone acylase PvdQ